MHPTDRQLSMRDLANASALGILPGGGADFGNDQGYYPYPLPVGPHAGHYRYPGPSAFGAEYGYEFGVEPSHPGHPGHLGHGGHHGRHMGHSMGLHPDHAEALRRLHFLEQRTREREELLEPNKGSSTKVERYDFSLNQALIIGEVSALTNMAQQPAVTLRPQRLITNAPSVGFVLFTSIQVANVAITVGQSTDAFTYSAGAFHSFIDAPTLSPANKATLTGQYNGVAPPPLSSGDEFIFVATFQGPATIVA